MSLNEELAGDPLAFAHKYCILAGSDARKEKTFQKKIGDYKYSKMEGLGKISFLDCSKAELAEELLPNDAPVEVRNRAVREGVDTILIKAKGRDGDRVPAFFLPWDPAGGTVSLGIPSMAKFDLNFWNANRTLGGSEIGGSKVLKEYPRLFLTAAVAGCSVFITGSDREPKIFHSGKDGTVEGNAIEVWRDMVQNITGKALEEMNTGEVNKSMYVKDGVTRDKANQHTTPTANLFEDALNKQYKKGPIRIQEVRPWGAVFGICGDGGGWEFYLQENATIRYDVIDKRFLGKKTVRPFSVSRPMVVRKVFPGGGGTAKLQPKFSWHPL